MRLSSRAVLIGSAVLAVVILVFGVGGVLLGREILINHADTPLIRNVARVTHFPIARVGSRLITYPEFLAQTDAQRTYLKGKEAAALGMSGAPTLEMQQSVYDQLIRVAAIEDLAKKYDFQVTPLDVDRSYDDLINQVGTSTSPGEVQNYLKENFGWSDKEFKEYIIRPALLKTGLAEKRKKDTGKDDAFDTELEARVKAPDVSRWLRFN